MHFRCTLCMHIDSRLTCKPMYQDPPDTRAQGAPNPLRGWLICRKEDTWDRRPVLQCAISVLKQTDAQKHETRCTETQAAPIRLITLQYCALYLTLRDPFSHATGVNYKKEKKKSLPLSFQKPATIHFL